MVLAVVPPLNLLLAVGMGRKPQALGCYGMPLPRQSTMHGDGGRTIARTPIVNLEVAMGRARRRARISEGSA